MNQFATKWKDALIEAKACKTKLNKLLNAETEQWFKTIFPELMKEYVN